MTPTSLLHSLNQERIVMTIAVVLFVVFSITLDNFITGANILSLIQSVAVLGVLGIAMAVVIIGRGIDLSLVATMALPVAWMLFRIEGGTPFVEAALMALVFALVVGLLNGFIIAYLEIPAIFATLAMGSVVYGFTHLFLVHSDVVYFPTGIEWFRAVGSGNLFGVPSAVVFFVVLAALVSLMLRWTKYGRYIYAIGDNPQAARITGLPVRPILMLQYVAASAIALLAGAVTAAAVSSMNTRVVNSTLVYDVILVVVLGGIGLSGGLGRVRNVVVGTLLIGILVNGMTIMDLPFTVQNLIKSSILLFAIVIDSVMNPRDEQISQQGDI
jgi:ribose transport system permease protein